MFLSVVRYALVLGCVLLSGPAWAAPDIQLVTPGAVGLWDEEAVTVSGQGFQGGPQAAPALMPTVQVNGSPVSLLFLNDVQFNFRAPLFDGVNTSLMLDVSVGGEVSNTVSIAYDPTPEVDVILSFSTLLGEELEIRGSNFEHLTGSFKIGGLDALQTKAGSSGQFNVLVPDGLAPGEHDIVLSSAAFGEEWTLGTFEVVPEPSSAAVFGLACLFIGGTRRRRARL